MERFMSAETVRKSRNRATTVTRLLIMGSVAALALFIVLCLLTRTGNARVMLIAAMVCAVLAGWGVMAFWIFSVEPARAEASHLEGLAAETAQTREGRITLDPEGFRIPKSVRVLKARLDTGEETLSLNLNEKYGNRVPPDGSLVRVETAKKFIIGMETLEKAEEQAPRKQPSAWKKFRRGFWKLFPGAVIWTLVAVVVTGFVFTRITDTDPAHKITIFVDGEVTGEAELAARLERGLGEPIRMVQIHPFRYAMFGSETLKTADLYIVPDSESAQYTDWFAPEEESWSVFDPETGRSVAGAYIQYRAEGGNAEPWRMYPGAGSPHLEDGLTRRTAELLLTMETEKQETGSEKGNP